tara:strand:+ start:410 stop:616 length:207 start_codon:yes stop_codon:yes gene_type:complete
MLMGAIFVLVAFVYFGGSAVPAVLRQNKGIILGVAIGCLVCCALGMKGMPTLEGYADLHEQHGERKIN